MPDIASLFLVCQALAVSFLAAWLTIGVYENIRHPVLNRTYTSEVLDLARLRNTYPEIYAKIAYRRISNKTLQHIAFVVIVIGELVATLLLWAGAISLFLGTENAHVMAMLGVMSFTTVWASFLIAGNWFCYWFCHEAAQNTHYQMVLWGLATLILLAVGTQI
jgi:predicted small integral membrane protein